MMMINGRPISFGTIFLCLLLLALIFPKTVFTVVLFVFGIALILGVLLFYRFRKWLALFNIAKNHTKKNQQNMGNMNRPYSKDPNAHQHSSVYECEEYEVIQEDDQKKHDP